MLTKRFVKRSVTTETVTVTRTNRDHDYIYIHIATIIRLNPTRSESDEVALKDI